MIKVVITIFLILAIPLEASIDSYSAVYKVKLGFLGVIGTIWLDYKRDKSSYSIDIRGRSEGIAKIFGSERDDRQISRGVIRDENLLPLEYIQIRETFTKKRIKKYIFDHQNRVVTLYKTDIIKEKKLSAIERVFGESIDDIEYRTTKTTSIQKLKRYSKNDLLTLYFNLKKILGRDLVDIDYREIYAIGTSKKDRYIKFYTPKHEQMREAREILGNGGFILALDLNQKIFLSNHGNLLLKIDKNGICQKAVLKDIVFGGDVVMELKELKKR